MEKEYKYTGVELTPNVFADLLISLFDGKQFDRQTAILQISEYHKSHGGVLKQGKDIITVFKKATQKLRDCGIQNKGYGTWRLNYKEKETTVLESNNKEQDSYPVDKEIGKGLFSVYLYYYDSYKELAELKGQHFWQCKIGRTDIEPIQRIVGQAGTCYPELPHIALIMYCDNSSQLEAAFHAILKVQKKHIESAPGREWFMTSPEEIEKLFFLIMESH